MTVSHQRLHSQRFKDQGSSESDSDSSEESDATHCSRSSGSDDEKIILYTHQRPSRKLWWVALGVVPLLVGGGLAAGLLMRKNSATDSPAVLLDTLSSARDSAVPRYDLKELTSSSDPTFVSHSLDAILPPTSLESPTRRPLHIQQSSYKAAAPLVTSSTSSVSSSVRPTPSPPAPPASPPPVPISVSSPTTGQAAIHRTGGPHNNGAVQASLDSTAASLPSGQYWIQNVASSQYMSFLRGAFVVPTHTVPNCLLTTKSSASPVTLSYGTTAASTWNPSTGTMDWVSAVPKQVVLQGVGTTGGCAAAQWDTDLGGNKALVSYPCFANAMSPLIKFVWYVVPKDAGSALPKRSFVDTVTEYFLITGNHIGGMVTTAATGSNLTAWNDQMGIALTDFVASDPWQLWKFETVLP